VANDREMERVGRTSICCCHRGADDGGGAGTRFGHGGGQGGADADPVAVEVVRHQGAGAQVRGQQSRVAAK
jgi:hypothetical protein